MAIEQGTVIASVVTTAGTIALAIFSHYQQKKSSLAQTEVLTSIQKVIRGRAEFQEHLDELGSRTNAGRALLLISTNGGGIPRLTGDTYIKIINETTRHHGLHPVQQDFQYRV